MIRFFKQRSQTTQPFTTNATSARTTLSPLGINEILELIFSYLDDNTIRRSAVLVCRQWRLLNQGRLIREVYWQEDWKSSRKERATRRLPGAGRLYCCLPFYTQEEDNDNKNTIRHILGRLESQYQKQLALWKRRVAPSTTNHNKRLPTLWTWTTTAQPRMMPTLFNFTPLRELNIYIDFNHGKTLNTFPFPASLTSLSITVRSAFYSEFDLSRILKSCTLLENLFVETYETPGVTLTWTTPFNSITTATPTSTTITTGATALTASQSLPLQSLVLSHVMLAQSYLENLLPHTPNLKELKLKGMMCFCTGKYDWTRLASCLCINNIILDNAHFSMSGTEMTPEEIEHFLTEVHSQSTKELTLWARDVTPKLLQTLFLPPTTTILTSLEVYWKRAATTFAYDPIYINQQELALAPDLIYRYLCESDHLIHLTTLKTAVHHEDLDLFGRAQYFGLDKELDNKALDTFQDLLSASAFSSRSSPFPKVWRCRRLRILCIDVLGPKKYYFQHAVQSRIVYGYISRVCPLLEELQICLPQDDRLAGEGCLDLKAGLCLLGRLRYLQKLRVYSNTMNVIVGCKSWDVDWIVDSGRRSESSRRSRHKEVEGWRMWRINEDQVEARRERTQQSALKNETSNSDSSSSGSGSVTATDTVILSQLRNLGLLLDVAEMLKEIDVEGCQVMPALERLSFKYPIMQRPEEELRRMFPTRLEKWRGY